MILLVTVLPYENADKLYSDNYDQQFLFLTPYNNIQIRQVSINKTKYLTWTCELNVKTQSD